MVNRKSFKKNKMIPQRDSKKKSSPPLSLRDTLLGHSHLIFDMVLSPDGNSLASSSKDNTVRLWNLATGRIFQKFNNPGLVESISWSPDGMTICGGCFGDLYLWNVLTGNLDRINDCHLRRITCIAWSPNGKILATGSDDDTVCLWDVVKKNRVGILRGHNDSIIDLIWSPDGKFLCSGSEDSTVRLWSAETCKQTRILRGHRKGFINNLSWSLDGESIAFSSDDRTIHIWHPASKAPTYALEGHTQPVIFVSFFENGRYLVSLDTSGSLFIWQTSSWEQIFQSGRIGTAFKGLRIATHPTIPILAALANDHRKINLWDINLSSLQKKIVDDKTVHYVNAKAVLLGEGSVGKSGLGIRMAEGIFRPTEGSTHGAQFWQFPIERPYSLPENFRSELTLWDLAGQPEYRLIHQLFLDDMDASLLLFDCSDPNDPFRGVHYWAKVLKKHSSQHTTKFLISSKCDVSPPTVDLMEINKILAKYDLHKYFLTSAKTGEGIEDLFRQIIHDIAWDQLPRTSTPELFQVIREFLLERKGAGQVLIPMDVVLNAVRKRYLRHASAQADIDTVVQQLQSQGYLHRLDPKPGSTIILLKPELINQYGSSIILAARKHKKGIGAVPEREVLVGDIPFSGFDRLPPSKEGLILESTIELLIQHDLCFREMGYLVFPSQINVTRTPPTESLPRTEVAYRFSGSIEMIYASLVVKLTYTDYFRREDQWKYAVEFSRNGDRLGFSMKQIEEGTGELEIYFSPKITDSDRVTFIRFVTDHLRVMGIDIHEEIRLYCQNCSKAVTDRDAIDTRIKNGDLDIPCQYCHATIMIPRSIEECYIRDPSLGTKQKGLLNAVKTRTQVEVQQFQIDQKQYTQEKSTNLHILHLSDLHLENEAQADICRTQLETDLKKELGIHRLDYLVISGDITNHASEEEYNSAFKMLNGIVAHFGLDPNRIIVVPGNHDVNWDASESSYEFIPKRKIPPGGFLEGTWIPAGEAGVLRRDDSKYSKRFAQFNDHFYRKIFSNQEYPTDYQDQTLISECAEDRMVLLELNSSWNIDHFFKNRASINGSALAKALDRFQDNKYDGWLKIAVWHHPVNGREMMNDDFMELLAVHGFQLCLHGHIHKSVENSYEYDKKRCIHVLGAGTFSASSKNQLVGIPLQYNLLTFDPRTGYINIQARKKEKTGGAWSADARWNNKNDPSASFRIFIENYKPPDSKTML